MSIGGSTIYSGEGGGEGRAYGRVAVGKGVVDAHVFEEPADVGLEEAFDLLEVEFGVDEDGADVRLYDIW